MNTPNRLKAELQTGAVRGCARVALWFQLGQLHFLSPIFHASSVAGEADIFEPSLIVGLREILAVMHTAAVFAQECAASDEFGRGQQVAQVERLLPGEIEKVSAGSSDLSKAFLQRCNFRQRGF